MLLIQPKNKKETLMVQKTLQQLNVDVKVLNINFDNEYQDYLLKKAMDKALTKKEKPVSEEIILKSLRRYKK